MRISEYIHTYSFAFSLAQFGSRVTTTFPVRFAVRHHVSGGWRGAGWLCGFAVGTRRGGRTTAPSPTGPMGEQKTYQPWDPFVLQFGHLETSIWYRSWNMSSSASIDPFDDFYVFQMLQASCGSSSQSDRAPRGLCGLVTATRCQRCWFGGPFARWRHHLPVGRGLLPSHLDDLDSEGDGFGGV